MVVVRTHRYARSERQARVVGHVNTVFGYSLDMIGVRRCQDWTVVQKIGLRRLIVLNNVAGTTSLFTARRSRRIHTLSLNQKSHADR